MSPPGLGLACESAWSIISHKPGFEAVQSGWVDTVTVQLYPLLDGWTPFARYTGTGREERIDQSSSMPSCSGMPEGMRLPCRQDWGWDFDGRSLS